MALLERQTMQELHNVAIYSLQSDARKMFWEIN